MLRSHVVPRNLFWIKDDKPDSGLINPLSRGLLRERPNPLLSEFIHTRLLLLLSPPPIEEDASKALYSSPLHGKWQMIGVVECDEYFSKFSFLFFSPPLPIAWLIFREVRRETATRICEVRPTSRESYRSSWLVPVRLSTWTKSGRDGGGKCRPIKRENDSNKYLDGCKPSGKREKIVWRFS